MKFQICFFLTVTIIFSHKHSKYKACVVYVSACSCVCVYVFVYIRIYPNSTKKILKLVKIQAFKTKFCLAVSPSILSQRSTRLFLEEHYYSTSRDFPLVTRIITKDIFHQRYAQQKSTSTNLTLTMPIPSLPVTSCY